MNGSPLASSTLAFVGGGNMARCLIGGARDAGVPASAVRVGEPSPEQRARLEADFGVYCSGDNAEAVAGADVVVVAVKPQAAAPACATFASSLAPGALVVSIMAGIRTTDLRRWLGDAPVLVRAMPNTPALIGLGISGLFATDGVPRAARERAEALLATAGDTVWFDDEDLFDAVTAVSGSGPAYAFLVTEALAAAGTAAGLDGATALRLAVQTMRGAAEMAARTGTEPAELRRQVTSPGGTTAAALEVLEASGIRAAFVDAVAAAARRSAELADEFGRR